MIPRRTHTCGSTDALASDAWLRARSPRHRGDALPAALVLALALALLSCLVPSGAEADEARGVHRVALVVGANNGGTDRVTLRFAEDDARRFVAVMQELGGLTSLDTLLVTDPSPAELDAAFEELGNVLEMSDGSSTRTEVLFYYSGHSDEQGLLLRGERVSYKALRTTIDALPADVRVIVLDSCAAGALTRTKGGKKVAPFLVDESSDVKGHAFLTSSSADEVAQESDRIGGSFFTHYLVSGLRGAADVSADGKVTLNEAYQFAFDQTLATTESTRYGPQHAVYEIQLTGTGDLVLTDLRETDATLEFSPQLSGRVSVRDDLGRLVAEVDKTAERGIALHVVAGTYDVQVDGGDDGPRATRVTVASGGNVVVGDDDVVAVALEETTPRGAPRIIDEPTDGGTDEEGEGDDGLVVEEIPSPTYQTIPFHIDLVPGLGVNEYQTEGDSPVRNRAAIHLTVGGTGFVDGFQLGALGAWSDHGVAGGQVAGIAALSWSDVDGVQIGGIYAGAEDVDGAQVAGIYAGAEDVDGLQLSGMAASARAIDGAQIALVNVGGDVKGAQIGLVNVGDRVEGSQVGLVNVASEVKAPIGLLNFVEDGILAVELWASETAFANVGLRVGGERVYTQLSVGSQVFTRASDDATRWVGEAAFAVGGRVPLGTDRVYLDVDIQHTQFFDEDGFTLSPMLERVRAAVNYRFTDWFAVYGGLSLNVWIAVASDEEPFPLQRGPVAPKSVREIDDGSDVGLEMTPGFFAGFEF